MTIWLASRTRCLVDRDPRIGQGGADSGRVRRTRVDHHDLDPGPELRGLLGQPGLHHARSARHQPEQPPGGGSLGVDERGHPRVPTPPAGLLADPAHRPSPRLVDTQHGGLFRAGHFLRPRDQRPVSGMPPTPAPGPPQPPTGSTQRSTEPPVTHRLVTRARGRISGLTCVNEPTGHTAAGRAAAACATTPGCADRRAGRSRTRTRGRSFTLEENTPHPGHPPHAVTSMTTSTSRSRRSTWTTSNSSGRTATT